MRGLVWERGSWGLGCARGSWGLGWERGSCGGGCGGEIVTERGVMRDERCESRLI